MTPSWFYRIYSFLSDYVDFSALETDFPIRSGEKRVVPAHSDVVAGKELSSALPDDNRPGFGRLAAVQFHTPVLRIAVSAVSRRALSLFMCHNQLPLISVQFLSISGKHNCNSRPRRCPEKFLRFVIGWSTCAFRPPFRHEDRFLSNPLNGQVFSKYVAVLKFFSHFFSSLLHCVLHPALGDHVHCFRRARRLRRVR